VFCSNRDTFAKLDGWHKGVLFVNGFNVGRYWPTEGPQQTLYVPATILKGRCQPNKVVIFEQDRVPCHSRKRKESCTIEFVTEPIINGSTPLAVV
jgi:beta-galactosidase